MMCYYDVAICHIILFGLKIPFGAASGEQENGMGRLG